MDRRWENVGGIVFAIFLLSHNSAKAEDTIDPTNNVNLSPFQAWRSAYYCLQNISTSCPSNYTLTMSGWLNVTARDGKTFCTGGCSDHTRDVILCLDHVKKDLVFENKATIKDLNETINNGCNTSLGFTGTSLYQSHGYRFSSAPVWASLPAAVLVMSLF